MYESVSDITALLQLYFYIGFPFIAFGAALFILGYRDK